MFANTADGDLKMQLRIAESQIYEQKREFKKGSQKATFVDKVTDYHANYFNSFAGNYVRDHIYDKFCRGSINIRGCRPITTIMAMSRTRSEADRPDCINALLRTWSASRKTILYRDG